MNRYNIFNQIHKGLRAFLYETANFLQQTDFSIAEEAAIANFRVSEVLELFDKHADTEDRFVLPVLEEFEPAITSLFAEEHIQDHALSNRLRSLLNIFAEAETTIERIQAGHSIKVSFVEFMVFNLNHMAKEENELNRMLWKYQTDEQLVAINQAIVAKVQPEDMARYAKWMMRGLSNTEIIDWLKDVKETAPGFVLNNLLDIVDAELPNERKFLIYDSIAIERFA